MSHTDELWQDMQEADQAQYIAECECEYAERDMALFIAKNSLNDIRRFPTSCTTEWYEGRISAAALIYPCPETLGAKNESKFLAGPYAKRWGAML